MTTNFELRQPEHAIGEFSASIKFRKPIDINVMPAVQERAAAAAQLLKLPAAMPIQMFQFGIGAPMPNFTPAPLPPSGFQRFAPDGSAEESLLIDGDTLTYTSRKYTRWAEMLASFAPALSSLASIYLPHADSVHSVRLQYLNEFRAISPDIKVVAELFKAQSKWIAPFGLDSSENWHCHIGQFQPLSENRRALVNVNCDVLEAQFTPNQPPSRYVKVLILSGQFFDLPNQTGLTWSEDDHEALAHVLNDAHRKERDILKEVIADPYLERMGALNDDY